MTTKSSSSSSSSSSTLNQDNRVAASEQSLALGQGASYSINNEFSEGVAGAYKELTDLVKTTVQGAGEIVKESLTKSLDAASRQSAGALEAVNAATTRAAQGEKTIYTDLFPIIALAAVVIVIISSKR